MTQRFQPPYGRRKVHPIPKGKRLVGEEREQVGAELADAYNKGAYIRELCKETGRSYGFIHRILSERPEVVLRPRGGSKPR